MSVKLSVVCGSHPSSPRDLRPGAANTRRCETPMESFEVSIVFEGKKIVPVKVKSPLPRSFRKRNAIQGYRFESVFWINLHTFLLKNLLQRFVIYRSITLHTAYTFPHFLSTRGKLVSRLLVPLFDTDACLKKNGTTGLLDIQNG